jgi:hypothetical protein
MNGQGGWFRRLGYKLKMGLVRFMSGRYGTDKLNSVLLWTGLILCLVSMFVPVGWANLVLSLLAQVFMVVALLRCFSRNTYKRYQENRRFLFMLQKLKDREHRYFSCPKCRQSVRVPKGKGKISITCPKCRERFVKKT